MGKNLKFRINVKSSSSLVENHNLRRKTAMRIKFDLNSVERRSTAGTKLRVDQIKRKMEAKFKKPTNI